MSKDSVSQWSTTPASNTDVGGVDLAENSMRPRDVNNAIRTMMAQIRATVPAGATTDNTLPRFDGTAGNLQTSGVTVDDSNQVGLGTGSPAAKLDISNNAGAIPAPVANTAVRLAGADGATPLFLIDAYAGEGQFAFRRGNTSAAAPSAVASGETIGGLTAYGHDGSGYISNSRAKFAIQAAQNWVPGAHGTQFTWETTANGGTSRTAKMVLSNDGGLVMGSPTGGTKGLGTINATAVYDDNTLLTCMALRARFLELGLVDTDYWDNLVPDLIVPERREMVPVTYIRRAIVRVPVVEEVDGRLVQRFEEQEVESEEQVVWADPIYDEAGNLVGAVETPLFDEVVTPEQVIPRRHELAHRFKAMVEDGFDPRDPIAYFAKLRADEALPGMPTKEDWSQGGLSTGEMTGRLWLAMEMLAIVTMNLHERVAVLEVMV